MKGYNVQKVGKRKTAQARVYIKAGSGNIIVNHKPYQEYFGRETLQMVLRQPLVLLGKEAQYDIKINVKGGGKAGQAGACRHGIARALDALIDGAHTEIKHAGFLTRDPREVERKKYGRHKARKRPQFSKR